MSPQILDGTDVDGRIPVDIETIYVKPAPVLLPRIQKTSQCEFFCSSGHFVQELCERCETEVEVEVEFEVEAELAEIGN